MRIEVEIQGESPLICNRFHDEAAEAVQSGTSVTVRGSKGTPREQAEKRLYRDTAGRPVIPGPNLFRSIIDAGRFHKSGRMAITTAKSSLVPAAVVLPEIECLIVNHEIDRKDPAWEVDSRRVVVPATGGAQMCHRPRFDAWRIRFTLEVDESMFDEKIVRALVDDAGKKIGLGDFRPARKGPFGRFKVVKWIATKDKART